jgi:excisionase family DNA binding protein
MDKQLYTAEEVAQKLAISRSQVFALKATAELPFVKIGRSARFRQSDLTIFINARVRRVK